MERSTRASARSARRSTRPPASSADRPASRRAARRAAGARDGDRPGDPRSPRSARRSRGAATASARAVRRRPWRESSRPAQGKPPRGPPGSGRAQLLEEPRALRRHGLVALLLRHRALLELGPRLLRLLLPRQDLAEHQVRVRHVGAFLRVPGKGLGGLLQPSLLRVDGPELPPAEAIL